MKKLILSFGLAILCTLAWSQDTKLLRFPDINGNKIVFSYSGDLYTCSTDGGTARRLTSHKGYEMFPKYSPDGSKIAFTAQYDGNTEVYIMPSDGGEPVRLTTTATLDRDDIADRMGPNNIVLDWTPDGKYVIFRSRLKSFNSFVGQLFKVSVDGGIQEQLPVPRGSWCSLDNTGTKMVYNRVFREFRTWKYYRGGMADDLWLYNFNDHSTTRLFSNDAQDIEPMWIGDKVYFISDRDRTMNLFSFDFVTKGTSKLTDFNKYDIKYPGHDDKSIIFEKGGEIYVYDLLSSTLNKIGIQIHEDFQNSRYSPCRYLPEACHQ
jgi:tricorn protease